MAIANFQDPQNYLKFLPILHDLPKRPFLLLFDSKADVLYIDFYNPPQSSDDSELTEDDIIIRYGDREEIVGLTILHASQRSEPISPLVPAA
jgi:uncharacterized protein YuzE